MELAREEVKSYNLMLDERDERPDIDLTVQCAVFVSVAIVPRNYLEHPQKCTASSYFV